MSRIVNQRYALLRTLGRGGMGEVWLAADRERPGALVALKYLPRGAAGADAERLREEFRRMSRLRHPHLVEVYDLEGDRERGDIFISMEYVEGVDFRAACRDEPVPRVLALAVQACRALEYLHAQGVSHRDLKPENVLVSPPSSPGEPPRLRLLDFGLAGEMSSAPEPGEPPRMAGTPAYMAPEQFRGEWVDHRADLYALGVLLYEALTGRLPFDTADPAASIQAHLTEEPAPPGRWRPGLDPAVEAIVLRLLRKRPAERYQSAQQVVQALQQLAAGREEEEERAARARVPRLVGRQALLAELDRLTAALLAADPPDPPPRLLLHGPAGAGKTRLAEEARALARSRGIEVLAIRAPEGTGGPFDLLRRLGAAAEAARRRLGAPPEGAPEEPGAAAPAAADPGRAWSQILALAEISPLLVLLEDLHEADADSLRALEEFLRLEEPARVALVATSRRPLDEFCPALAEHWVGAGAGRQEPLEPLGDSDVSALLASMFGAPAGAPAPDPLLRLATGNPLFAVEWALALAERGLLEVREGAWWIDRAALDSMPAPPGLVEIARLRLGGLSPDERRLITTLAAFGRPVHLGDAAAVAALAGDRAAAAVEEAMQRGLLATQGDPGVARAPGLLALAHRALQEAARAEAGGGFADLYARATARLEAAGRASAVELAQRWRESGDVGRMKSQALRAAEEAEAAGAWEQQILLLEWALEATPSGKRAERLSLMRRLAAAPYSVGAFERALPHLARLEAEAESVGDRATLLDALVKHHACCVWLLAFRESAALEDRIHDELRARPDPFLEAKFERALAQRAAAEGDTTVALEHARRAGDLFRVQGNPVEAALCLNNAGAYLLWLRSPEETERLFTEAESLLLEAGDEAYLFFPRLNLAITALQRGRWAEAERILMAEIEGLHGRGRQDVMAQALLELALARERGGWPERALEDYREAARLAARLGLHSTRLHALEREGSLLRLLGLHERAAAVHAQGLETARRLRLPLQVAFLSAALAEDACAAGDVERASALAAAALADAERLGHRRARLRAALACCRAALARGDAGEADACLAVCRSLTEPTHHLLESAQIGILATRLALLRGDRDGAGAALDRGLEHARLGSLRAEAAEMLAVRIEAGISRDPAEDRRGLREALQALGARVSDPAMARLVRFAPAWKGAVEALETEAAGAPSEGAEARLAERRALRALAGLGRTIETLEDPRRLAASLLEQARDLLAAERALLVLTDPEGGGARIAASSALSPDSEPEALEFSRAALARGLEGPLLVLDACHDPRLASSLSVERFGIRSVVCAPLRLRGTLLGALYLDSRGRVLQAGRDHLRFLEAFAHQMAAALDAARALEALRSERERLRGRVLERYRFHSLLGRSPAMQHVYDLLEPFSKSDLPVLVTGESGTGKELVARALHWNGPRREGPFVAESCAAIPENLLESELFGHLKGAFTGAERDRRGVFVEASGGTLLLDEIGEMTPTLQAKLLRVLQEKEVRPLGAGRPIPVDVRIVAATNRDLGAAVRAGTFREDLVYRLRVLTLHLPPLRERLEDLPLLARHFLAEHRREHGRGPSELSAQVLERLERYSWPGNVRELRSEVLKMALVAEGPKVEMRELEGHPELFGSLLRPGRATSRPQPGTLRDVERLQVERALRVARGDKEKAARLLGLSRATLYRKLRRYRISAPAGH